MNYRKPKRYFEKSGVVDPNASYYVELENITNTNNQDIKTMVDLEGTSPYLHPGRAARPHSLRAFAASLKHTPHIFLSS